MAEHPRVFAVADLHLPGGSDKPMDIFGSHWEGHADKIAAHWQAVVTAADIVLVPGDISWAMQLKDALPDLHTIAALPGRKVLIRGNHDYWWTSISKLRAALPDGMYALQNDAIVLDGITIGGSRSWMQPLGADDAENSKIYARELMRMELSLSAGRRLSPQGRMVAMSHYPPVDASGAASPMSMLFERYQVSDVVYGHLHGSAHSSAFRGTLGAVRYHCVSCDSLNFALLELPAS